MFFFLIFAYLFSNIFIDTFFGVREWLMLNDLSRTNRRKPDLAEAPNLLESDRLPLVFDSGEDTTLLCNE